MGMHKSTGTSSELEFRVHDPALFFVRASVQGARVTLAEMVTRSDGRMLEYFAIQGAPPDTILEMVAETEGIDDARLIREDEDEALFEFVLSGPCVGATLADAGAVVREVVAKEGIGYVLADVPPHANTQQVIETVQARHDADLFARRERERPAPEFTHREFRATLTNQLTECQLEALRTAYAGGYFNWPRKSTAEECAEALGVTQPTFSQHLRAGEHKLLGLLFDELQSDDESDLYRRVADPPS